MKDLHRWDFTSGIAALLIFFLIILFPGPAKCEEEFGFWVSYAQGIKITYTPTSFEVAAYTLNDRPTATVVKKGKGETIYYGFKKREINWLFGKHKIKVSFTTDEPREKGMCSATPGSTVNIWIDGQQVMKQQLFNNECHESLMSTSFEQKKEGHFVFKICGHERMSGRPINNKCFVFQEEAFWSLPKPLPMSPITELKEKGYMKEIHAASFDCGKATSEVEKLICGDDELSKLDESLNKAYLQALQRTDIKKQTIESQRQWLKNERNACQNAECIKEAYETRIKELGLLSSHGIVTFRPQKNIEQQHESTSSDFVVQFDRQRQQLTVAQSSFMPAVDTQSSLEGISEFALDPTTLTKLGGTEEQPLLLPNGRNIYKCRLGNALYRVVIEEPYILNERVMGQCGAVDPVICLSVSRDGEELFSKINFDRCYPGRTIHRIQISGTRELNKGISTSRAASSG